MKNLKYESVIIIKPDLSDENKSKIKESIISLIDSSGKVTEFEDLGIKKLAYNIKNNNTGWYIVIKFMSKSSSEIEKKFRTFEEIMKFIVVRQEE